MGDDEPVADVPPWAVKDAENVMRLAFQLWDDAFCGLANEDRGEPFAKTEPCPYEGRETLECLVLRVIVWAPRLHFTDSLFCCRFVWLVAILLIVLIAILLKTILLIAISLIVILEHWSEEHWSEEHGRTYFWNAPTQEAEWELPDGGTMMPPIVD